MFGFGINVWYYLQNNLRTMRIPYELGFGALKLPLAVTDWHLIDNFRQVIIAISRWKGKFDTLLTYTPVQIFSLKLALYYFWPRTCEARPIKFVWSTTFAKSLLQFQDEKVNSIHYWGPCYWRTFGYIHSCAKMFALK